MSDKAAFEREFAILQSQYGIDEAHHYFNEQNWHVALKSLKEVIERIDRDVRQMYFDECFPVKHGELDFSEYGRQLVCARYCVGWIMTLVQGGALDKHMAQALVFIYAAYWKLGEDFLLGNIVENLLRAAYPARRKIAAPQSGDEATLLGLAVWDAMQNCFSTYYSPHYRSLRIEAGPPAKPAFDEALATRLNALFEPPKKKERQKAPSAVSKGRSAKSVKKTIRKT